MVKILYYDKIDISKGIDPTKITKVDNPWFAAISFLIMDPNFKINKAKDCVTIWQC